MAPNGLLLRAMPWGFLLWAWIVWPCEAYRRTKAQTTTTSQTLLPVETSNATQTLRRAEVVVNVPTNPDGHLVTDPLPLTKEGDALKTRHWAGHLPVADDKKNYFFYWLFEPENADKDTPLIIWLNGGPACSSMDGLFLENGPIEWTILNGEYRLQQNPHSWHKAPAYTLYIDQPVGTGLSFTTNKKYPTNFAELNADFYYFLNSFFKLHSDKFVSGDKVNAPVFMTGESYSGKYIPSMMAYILEQNRRGAPLQIPLAGAAIGNGWFDPYYQYASAEAAYGHGLIGRAQLNALTVLERKCQSALAKGNYDVKICYDLQDKVVDNSFGTESEYRVSSYDVRLAEKKGQPRKFPKGHKVVEGYLGGWKLPQWEEAKLDTKVKDTVLKAIHATAATQAGLRYQECTDPPYDALAGEDGKGVIPEIAGLLDHPSKPKLLFFTGIEDLVCDHVGTERALENIPWAGQSQWMSAKRFGWLPFPTSPRAAGFMKQYDTLMFLKILDSGHMVPMDKPEVALEMMKTLMHGGSFTTSKQNLEGKAPAPGKCETCDTCPAPAPLECPTCSLSGPSGSENCTEQVSEALSSNKYTMGSIEGKSPATAIGGVVLVAAMLIYASWLARKRSYQAVEVGNDHVEMQTPRYRDESDVPNE